MITPTDIAVRLGSDSLSGVEKAQYAAWINEALYLIGLKVNIATADIEALDYVLTQAVLDLASGPAPGVIQESIQADDGMISTRYAKAQRRIVILPEWWEMLGVTVGGGQAFSIDMGYETSTHWPWCDRGVGASTCSCGASIAGFPIYEGGE